MQCTLQCNPLLAPERRPATLCKPCSRLVGDRRVIAQTYRSHGMQPPCKGHRYADTVAAKFKSAPADVNAWQWVSCHSHWESMLNRNLVNAAQQHVVERCVVDMSSDDEGGMPSGQHDKRAHLDTPPQETYAAVQQCNEGCNLAQSVA